jgi:large subunit ribosomal protein L24
MKIVKNDKIKVLVGKDRGKTGKVLKVMPKKNKVVVEGLNLIIKNVRPRRQGEKGQRIQFPRPIDISNVMLICPHCGKPVHLAYKLREDKKKVRICKKCQQAI